MLSHIDTTHRCDIQRQNCNSIV